jgi:hypothetical protein
VKSAKNWKDAIGQVIAYGHYYPDRSRVIHLFKVGNQDLAEIRQICDPYGIVIRT